MLRILCACFVALLIPLTSVATAISFERQPKRAANEYGLIASFYHEGHTTANGEHYNPDGVSCAHRTHKFGTMLKVTNRLNGKSIVCRVNDRGPSLWTGVEVDLSRGAFRQIENLEVGRIPVLVEVVS